MADILQWITDENQWITEEQQFFETNNFSVEANIVSDITSGSINTEREFTSQSDNVFDISSDIIRGYFFTTTSNIAWDVSSSIGMERIFTAQADIAFNLPDISHGIAVNFLTQPFINFNTDSTLFALKDFASQADIVSDIVSDIDQGGIFSVLSGISTNIRSDIKLVNKFQTIPIIISNISNPEIYAERKFVLQPDIFWNTVSNMGGNRTFLVQADLVWDVISDNIQISNILSSQADIISDIISDIKSERHFASQADIVWDAISNIFQERLLSSQVDIVSDIVSDIKSERHFASQVDIVSDINTDASATRNFKVNFGDATIIQNIIVGADDGNCLQSGGSFNNTDFEVYIGFHFGDRHTYFRFDNTAIPHGAIIKSAVLKLIGSDTQHGTDCNVIIHIEDADDPTAPSSDVDLLSRPLGSGVAWNNLPSFYPGTVQDSPDIANILQTHINRSGWNAGQALSIHILNVQPTNNERRVSTFENPNYDAAIIEIEYEHTPQIVQFNTQSDIKAEREFSIDIETEWDLLSNLNQDMTFLSQADLDYDILSDIRSERRFITTPNILWNITSTNLRRFLAFHVEPDVDFLIPASPVNIFKENLFGCIPSTVFDIVSDIRSERRFAAHGDIAWVINLTHIFTVRNFASTVNIVINIESLNILTMSLDDLFPNTMRSVTQKLTAILVN